MHVPAGPSSPFAEKYEVFKEALGEIRDRGREGGERYLVEVDRMDLLRSSLETFGHLTKEQALSNIRVCFLSSSLLACLCFCVGMNVLACVHWIAFLFFCFTRARVCTGARL